MLYQLSYASRMGHMPFRGHITPSDPFTMSGTIIKVTITALYVQTSTAYQPRPEFLATVLNRAECYYGRISGLILAEMSIGSAGSAARTCEYDAAFQLS